MNCDRDRPTIMFLQSLFPSLTCPRVTGALPLIRIPFHNGPRIPPLTPQPTNTCTCESSAATLRRGRNKHTAKKKVSVTARRHGKGTKHQQRLHTYIDLYIQKRCAGVLRCCCRGSRIANERCTMMIDDGCCEMMKMHGDVIIEFRRVSKNARNGLPTPCSNAMIVCFQFSSSTSRLCIHSIRENSKRLIDVESLLKTLL